MEDPIKIIHKYKNNNGRIQYHVYIFVGSILDDKTTKILNKIKNLDLYITLTTIDEKEHNILISNYGNFWYEKFFVSYHINSIKETTLKNPTRLRELKTIYGNDWVNLHFTEYKRRIETVTYSYETMIKEERERKTIKKIIQKQVNETEDIIDYTTSGKIGFEFDRINTESSRAQIDAISNKTNEYNIFGSQNKPYHIIDTQARAAWCRENSDSSSTNTSVNRDIVHDDIVHDDIANTQSGAALDSVIDDETIDTGLEYQYDEFNMDAPDENTDEAYAFDEQVEQDLDDADLLFSELDDADKNVKLTTKEIKEAISNETYDKISKHIIEFDQTKDNSMFDENLKDIYQKIYILHQFIYKDDTIKTIHNKICCAIKNNNKFDDNAYIIPSYQHLWTEYPLANKTEKVMIGKKWIIRNDVLKLDVEPNNNLSVYEDLRGNLRTLRDNIRRQGKIKLEDDENNIFNDYDNYYTFNEIFMIDIYNEFGLNYNPNFDELKNILDVYLRIYFPAIHGDDIKNIIDLLKKNNSENKSQMEIIKLKTIFDTTNNDLILENEIMKDIELVKKKNKKEYVKIFQENYVTQSVIRAYLTERYNKLNLFRVFDNFMLDDEYPFIQYQPTDGTPRYRYSEKYLMQNEKKEIIMKWFENSPYGISFKVKVNEKSNYKYMAINLNDNGRIDYKIQWKEEDMSTVDDIKQTYQYIRKLIEKINRENEKFNIQLNMPSDDDFKFAFINTIQRFELPNDFVINHNDLSEFSRYFYPYVALVIEPRKRQSKIKKNDKYEKSKFGTYLRYKRVNKYENRTKIEHRIIFFMRNYEYDDQSLSNEISKEFNITLEQAIAEIENVRDKYPNIRKSRRVLKKLENIPKFKPPGIGVDIQGKTRNKYKMRIAGARDKNQLDRIITFMNVLIYLYVETYLYKNPDRQRMKDRLKRLTKIARRRNKVDEIIYQDTNIKNVKQMTSIDQKRLGYKAEEDISQWTRDCQNSGNDKQRRPQQILNADELQKMGYVWKDTLDEFDFGHYERQIMVDNDGKLDSTKKKHATTLRAIKLSLDDTGENHIYYTCGPEENGKHMYIGFLSKSKNPYGEPMPCCFIKDHLYSKNKEKRNFYLRSIGLLHDEDSINKISGDQLYILQDSNKIQEGRFAFLPKYLDIFMNYMMQNDRVIKNHYLLSTSTGYYFKYGTRQDEYKYLNSVCSVFDLTVDKLKTHLIRTLESDKHNVIFTSLNNGDIRAQFGSVQAYINFIKHNEYLEYELLNDLLCIPGVLSKHGINIIIFQKKVSVIKKNLEKEKLKESYHVICQNSENTNDIINPQKETVLIIKENKNYFPIIMVQKDLESSKEVNITKTFIYNDTNKNIINHIFKYYKINCQSEYSVLINENSTGSHNAKQTYAILSAHPKREFHPKSQIIDARFKCKYLITNAGYLVPTTPSGCVYNINISNNLDYYIKDYQTTIKYLRELYVSTSKQLGMEPIGVYYRDKKNKSLNVTAIMTSSYDSVPIIEKNITIDYITREKLLVQNKPNDDVIDKEITKGATNRVIDNRIYQVSKNNYETELYQLFRLHLSYYLNYVANGIKTKEKLVSIMESNTINKRQKKLEIKKLLYQITSTELAKKFNELLKARESQKGGISQTHNANYQTVTEVQIIPEDVYAKKIYDTNSTHLLHDNHDITEPILPPPDNHIQYQFSKNEPPSMSNTYFQPDEKSWLSLLPENKEINYPAINIKNNRELCYNNENKSSCNNSNHCNWVNSKSMCMFAVKRDMLIDFINLVAEEFIQAELKAQEILRRGEYFVSDIVNYNVFTERPGERIIMTSNTNLNKILREVFGKENIPKIGKRRSKLESIQNYDQLNMENPLKNVNNWYIQNIIENNNTVFRAFANAYYWLLHPYNDTIYRNLGYYSATQTSLSNIYKSLTIDWLLDIDHEQELLKLRKYIKYGKLSEFTAKLSTDVYTLTNCVIELYILSKIYNTIIYVRNDNYDIIYAFHPTSGIIYDHVSTKSFSESKYRNFKKIINLRFQYFSKDISPDRIETLYAIE